MRIEIYNTGKEYEKGYSLIAESASDVRTLHFLRVNSLNWNGRLEYDGCETLFRIDEEKELIVIEPPIEGLGKEFPGFTEGEIAGLAIRLNFIGFDGSSVRSPDLGNYWKNR